MHDGVFGTLHIDLQQVQPSYPPAQEIAAMVEGNGQAWTTRTCRKNLVIAGIVVAQVQLPRAGKTIAS